MASERELRVVGALVSGNDVLKEPLPEWCFWGDADAVQAFDEQCWDGSVSEPVRFVILECDGKRCGDLERWMVEWLYGNICLAEARHDAGVDFGSLEEVDEHIATAISRILQEAQGHE